MRAGRGRSKVLEALKGGTRLTEVTAQVGNPPAVATSCSDWASRSGSATSQPVTSSRTLVPQLQNAELSHKLDRAFHPPMGSSITKTPRQAACILTTRLYAGGELQVSPVWQALSGHKRRIPLAVVLPRPGRAAVSAFTVSVGLPRSRTRLLCP